MKSISLIFLLSFCIHQTFSLHLMSFSVFNVPSNIISNLQNSSSIIPLVNSTSNNECDDGICKIPQKTEAESVDPTVLVEMEKLGWNRVDATRALIASKNDMIEAIQLLETEEELKDIENKQIKKLTSYGWNEDAAAIALRECQGNLTKANEMLDLEEKTIGENFDKAVLDMMENGWEEVVARQALHMQWTLDQRKAAGLNTTISRESLDSIRPSLKKLNSTQPTLTKSTDSKESKSTPAAKSQDSKTPKPAKKEDVVFEVNSENFQKIVLESPVPVLLDIYADWCGPCKQLGPVLEDAAVRAGGMFRLCKVNSDKERAIAEALDVSALPTVFALVKGKISDMFKGMLPGEQIQKFLIRAVTGHGDRLSASDLSDAQLQDMTQKIRTQAGMASINFKKKEKLYSLIEDAMKLDKAYEINLPAQYSTTSPKVELHEGVRVVLAYLENCQKDILLEKYRKISTSSKTFQEKVALSPAALRLIEIAGFKSLPSQSSLELIHSNSALITLVIQKINALWTEKRLEIIKNFRTSNMKTQQKESPKTNLPHNSLEKKEIKPNREFNQANNEIIVNINGIKIDKSQDNIQKSVSLSPTTSLSKVITSLLGWSITSPPQHLQLELRFPLPRRIIDLNDKTFLSKNIGDVAGKGKSISLGLIDLPSVDSMKDINTSKKVTNSNKDKKTPKGKTHTLFSSGLLGSNDKKHNEYFGGDSTVVLAGDETKPPSNSKNEPLEKEKKTTSSKNQKKKNQNNNKKN